MTLSRYVLRYQLRLGHSAVWAPYWLNSPNDPFWMGAPLIGKGAPAQLRHAAQTAARGERVAPQSPEEWRLLMRRHGLGIDCSGFVYHVLDAWLRQQGSKGLAVGLVCTAVEIAARNRRYPELARRWRIAGGPQTVPAQMSLGEACDLWGLSAASWVNVRRLVDPAAVQPIYAADELRPGDLIVTSKAGTDHIGVVVSRFAKKVVYADSAHDAQGLGGVTRRQIQLEHPGMGLEAQMWPQQHLYHPGEPGSVDGMWRLNEVARYAK